MRHFFVKPAFQWTVKFIIPLTSVVIVIILGVVHFTFAAPSFAPLTGNLPYPLNDSAIAQTKTGSLTLQSSVNAASLTSSQTNAATVCLPGGCANTWPSVNYTAPTLAQVLAAGNSTSHRLNFGDDIGGFNFNGSGYRTEWYTGNLYNGPKYNTSGQCAAGYVICRITSTWGSLTKDCCQVLVDIY